ncbi:protein of unknown function [Burkholderia multivorans]
MARTVKRPNVKSAASSMPIESNQNRGSGTKRMGGRLCWPDDRHFMSLFAVERRQVLNGMIEPAARDERAVANL